MIIASGPYIIWREGRINNSASVAPMSPAI
jgi:hypothetical protein